MALKLRVLSHLSAVALVAAAFASLPAHAITINPSQDAYTNSASPVTNFGGSTSLVLNGGDSNRTQDYLQFDLSAWSGMALLGPVTLTLNVNIPDQGIATGTINVMEETSAWTESGITWASPPLGGGPVLGSTGAISGSPSTITISLTTSLVQGWLDNPATNYGLWLNITSGGYQTSFDSREAASGQPTLSFNVAPAPEPGSIALMAAPLLLLAIRKALAS